MFRKQFQFFQNLTSGFLNKQKAIDINTLDTGARFLPIKKAKMPPNIEYKHTKPQNQTLEVSDTIKTSVAPGNLEINPYSIPNRFVLEKLAKSSGVSTNDLLLSEFSGKNISDDVKKVTEKLNNAVEFNIHKSRENFLKVLEKSKIEPVHLKNMQNYAKNTRYIHDTKAKSAYSYDSNKRAIIYNPSHTDFKMYDEIFAHAHELSHRADHAFYESWQNKEFIDAIEKTRKKVYTGRKEIRQLLDEETGKYYKDSGFSDIISALTGGSINRGFAHKKKYWKDNPGIDIAEIFANMNAVNITDSKCKIEFFNNGILSDIYEPYKKIIQKGRK